MAVVLWSRAQRDVVRNGGKALVFASSAEADVWLARRPVAPEKLALGTVDKLTVTA
jgi:hypothetical protein